MSGEGWIKLHRKLQDSEIWVGEKFTRGQAWVDMILMANHTDKTFSIRGNKIQVKRGQIARAERTIASKWGWSRDKVRRFFSWLETRQQILQQKNKLLSIVTILNYDEYQQNDTTEQPQKSQKQDHRKDHKQDHRNYTELLQKDDDLINKKTTEIAKTAPQKSQKQDLNKNVLNKNYSRTSTEVELSQLLFDLICNRNPNHRPANLQLWARQIDLMIRVDKRDPNQIRDLIEKCQKDEFWKNNILSTTKLRKQYDQLILKLLPNPKGGSTGSKLLDNYYADTTRR